MRVRYKMYPYPVLAEFTDDYTDSRFDVKAEEIRHGYDRKLYFQAVLKNEGLMRLIEDGKAEYVYHLECSQTAYRKVIRTGAAMTEHLVPHRDVCGKLQITPFVAAKEELPDYTNEAFHPDYEGVKFDIERGCLLAVGTPYELIIENEIDELAKIPSIFSIIPNFDETVTHMTVELDNAKILISLPREDFQKYKLVSESAAVQDILNSMIVIPALISALDRVQETPAYERRQLEDEGKSWYRTIKKVLAEKFGCDIESAEFDAKNTVELAQELIGEPLHEALESLISLGSKSNGGDGE